MIKCNTYGTATMDPEYRISTITATGSVNTDINLDIFYDSLLICDEDSEGVVYVEYGKKKSETMYKGFSKKFLINKRKVVTTTKRFENQVTMVYRKIETNYQSLLNIKVFRNGNVQITGIKYIEQGHNMISIIVDMLNKVYETGQPVVSNIASLENKNYNICLINSDFRIGFSIKRELLYKTFCAEYSNDCSFEPCIYPGVKIQYFYNTTNKRSDGICYCDEQCIIGKGCGTQNGKCKKITIAVFQSGCVIITGAQNHDQIKEAYKFISNVLHSHRNAIEKKTSIVDDVPPAQPKKIVMINKKNIVYPSSLVRQ